jgi:hypothetical protein
LLSVQIEVVPDGVVSRQSALTVFVLPVMVMFESNFGAERSTKLPLGPVLSANVIVASPAPAAVAVAFKLFCASPTTPEMGVLLHPPDRLPAGDLCAERVVALGLGTLPNIRKKITFPGAVRGVTDTVNVGGGGGGGGGGPGLVGASPLQPATVPRPSARNAASSTRLPVRAARMTW